MANKINTQKSGFFINLSDADKKKLSELATEADMTITAYIRMLIDCMWVSHNSEEILKTGKFSVYGEEFSLNPTMLTEIGEEIVNTLSKVDWSKLQVKAKEKPILKLRKGYKKAS